MPVVKPAATEHAALLLELIAAYHAYDGIETTAEKRRVALEGLMSSPQFGQVWVVEDVGKGACELLGYGSLLASTHGAHGLSKRKRYDSHTEWATLRPRLLELLGMPAPKL